MNAGRLRTALGLCWQVRPWLLVGYVCAHLLLGAVPVAAAWLVKSLLDRLAADADVWGVIAGMVVCGMAVAVLPPAIRYLQAELGRSVAVGAKDRLYRVVTGYPLLNTLENPAFRDQLRLAEQASRSGPAQVVDSGLGAAQAAVTLGGLGAAMVVIAPWVAVVLVAAATVALVAELRLNRRRFAMLMETSPAERREFFYTDLLTNLSAAKEIRLFGTAPLFHRRMLAELATVNAARRRMDRRELVTEGGLAALSAVLAGGALVWIVRAAARGSASVGDVAAVVVAVGSVQAALTAVVQHIAGGHHAGMLLDHYRELVGTPVLESTPEAPTPPTTAFRGIEMDDVWFRYGDGQPWVLRGVTFTIPDGTALALVGENGAGKSTLVKLLCRYYEPTRGSIRWHGVDLRLIPVDELRRRIGAVFQDFMSYDLTAAENIALGDTDGRAELDLAPDRLRVAAAGAEAHEAISALPHGYDTMLSRLFTRFVGDDGDGVLLSGGQWQRLAVARALVRGSRELLILDEPSAGLDAEAEHRIHRRLAEHRRGRTSVLISHRLNTVRDADRIVVFADGRVVEQGTHAQLLVADGCYARLFRLQAEGYTDAPAERYAERVQP